MTTIFIKIPIQEIDQFALGYLRQKNVPHRKRKKICPWHVLRAAHGNTIFRIKLVDGGRALEFRGSLFKVLYGQNALVTNAFDKHIKKKLVPFVITRVNEIFPEVPIDLDSSRPIEVKQVDIVRHYRLGSEQRMAAALLAIKNHAARTNTLSAVKGDFPWSTISMRRGPLWDSARVYAKGRELQALRKAIPISVPHAAEITEATKLDLRVELTLKTPQLEGLKLNNLENWHLKTISKVFRTFLNQWAETGIPIRNDSAIIEALSAPACKTYVLWRSCHPRKLSRATLARHQRELKAFGINLKRAPDLSPISNVRLEKVFSPNNRVKMGRRRRAILANRSITAAGGHLG